jgi:hypothetical protein
MTREEIEARLAEVNKLIDEAPGWGAYVAVLGEEQRSLLRQLRHKEKQNG